MQLNPDCAAESSVLTDPAEPSGLAVEPSAAARARIHDRAQRIAERELDRTCSELDLDPEQRAELERLTDRLVARLLAGPDASLRTVDDEAVAVAALALLTD